MVNIIVAFPRAENARQIRNVLVRNGIHVTAVCNTGGQVIQRIGDSPDTIVICAYRFRDMVFRELREYLPEECKMLLLISREEQNEIWETDVELLTIPIKINELIRLIDEMMERIHQRNEAAKKKRGIRSKKDFEDIEYAKQLLQQNNQLTEPEAHKYLQKRSMDSGLNLATMARMIIDSYII